MKPTKRKAAKRQAAQPETVPALPVIPAPISTTLSPQASELVRWYCGVTKHQEDAAVEGAVFGILERAKDAYEEGSRHDEAFNWLMEDVLRGMNDFDRQLGPRTHRPSLQVNQRAAALLRTWHEYAGHDPRDTINGMLVCAMQVLDGNQLTLGECISQAKEDRLREEGEWSARQPRKEAA